MTTQTYRIDPRPFTKRRKPLDFILAIVEVLVGLGGLAGGAALLANPSGAGLGLNPEMLGTTPFADFLIPGIALVIIGGLVPLAAALMALANGERFRFVHVPLGILLIVWTMIQVIVIGSPIPAMQGGVVFAGLVLVLLGTARAARP